MQMTVFGKLLPIPGQSPDIFFQDGANNTFWFFLEDPKGNRIRVVAWRKDLTNLIPDIGGKLKNCQLVAIGRYEHAEQTGQPTLHCDMLSVYVVDAIRKMENEALALPPYVSGLFAVEK